MDGNKQTSPFDDLTTRPVLVFAITFGFSSATAGAALGLAVFVAAFFGAAAFFDAAAFLAAGFFAVVVFFAAAVFFGAAFFAVVAFSALGFVSVFAALGAAAVFFSAGLASFTGPEAPLGWAKAPESTPVLRALLMCVLKALSVVAPRLLLALMYFLIA